MVSTFADESSVEVPICKNKVKSAGPARTNPAKNKNSSGAIVPRRDPPPTNNPWGLNQQWGMKEKLPATKPTKHRIQFQTASAPPSSWRGTINQGGQFHMEHKPEENDTCLPNHGHEALLFCQIWINSLLRLAYTPYAHMWMSCPCRLLLPGL